MQTQTYVTIKQNDIVIAHLKVTSNQASTCCKSVKIKEWYCKCTCKSCQRFQASTCWRSVKTARQAWSISSGWTSTETPQYTIWLNNSAAAACQPQHTAALEVALHLKVHCWVFIKVRLFSPWCNLVKSSWLNISKETVSLFQINC